jgi:hypothetical protein
MNKNYRKISPYLKESVTTLLPNVKVVTTTYHTDGTKTINGKVIGYWK